MTLVSSICWPGSLAVQLERSTTTTQRFVRDPAPRETGARILLNLSDRQRPASRFAGRLLVLPAARESTTWTRTAIAKERPQGAADGTLVEVMPADGPDDSKKTDSKKTEEQQAPESQQERDESADSEQEAKSAKPRRPWLKYAIAAAILLVVVVSLPFLIPWIGTVLNTVSTDDAYVNGHVTFVAPRVAGQVQHVLVDDNMRVKKGDLLVELDKEPYRIQLSIKQAAVTAAETDLKAARAQVRGLIGLARSQRWMLQSAMDQVANQVANLRANVATYESRKASLALAQANYARGAKSCCPAAA